MMEWLATRLHRLISRGKVTGVTRNAARTMLQISGFADEQLQEIEVLGPYGMDQWPLPGGDVLIVQSGGSRSHALVVHADDPALRISDLAEGEFGFRDARGQQVVFRKDRLEITTPLKVVGSASEWDITGDVHVNGNIFATGDVTDGVRSMAADRGKYDSHTHGGVQTGSGHTAIPDPLE